MGDLVGQGEAILAGLAVLTAFGLLLRKLGRFIRKASRLTDRIVGDDETPGLLDNMKTLQTNQERILHELFPNGGGSLRDAVDRVTHSVDEVKMLATDAKERAAEAVDEAANLSAALGRADAIGRKEREVAQKSLDRVLDAFLDDRRETYSKTRAYILALKKLGIDLTDVATSLDEEPWDGGERRES